MTRRIASLAVLATALAACWDEPAAGPPLGYETSIEACSDGIDNDRDGRVDCADTDCVARSFCNEIVPDIPPNEPDEDSLYLCTNRIDDDDDGNFDCGDRSCGQFPELCCTTEFTDERCSNGIDDDENGFTDCEDFGCSQGVFVTVCDREVICDDGIDNDNDGLADCLDEKCTFAPPCEGEVDCENGVDDEGDALADCLDPECATDPACRMPEDTAAVCADGIDNDRDGFADCRDFDCDPFCEDEDTLEKCLDGVDNDMNGFTDCNDFSCSMHDEAEIREACAERIEADFAKCTDGIDNDGNGFADCNDFSCQRVVDVEGTTAARAPCLESAVDPDALDRLGLTRGQAQGIAADNCSDGEDNDEDGFVDCDDWDCNWNPLLPGFCEMRTGTLLCR